AEDGGDLYLINGNMTKLANAGIFADSGGKENEDDEKVLELEDPDGDEDDSGTGTGDGTDAGNRGRKNPVPERRHR
ncbi:MAG: hypothetical protein LUC90_00050, partial [Lachnospiraceae bacterium]|nr:hypothetical protein [Lachnospiraceae bacterium]